MSTNVWTGLYDSVAEYDQAIAETKIAIRRAKLVGHSHKNVTFGDERSTTEVSLYALKKDLLALKLEKAEFIERGSTCISIGAAW